VSPAQAEAKLSPIEGRLRDCLVERAKKADSGQPFRATITYGDLCKAVDPDQHYWKYPRFRGIGPAIGRVSVWEHEHGRPLLSALVVQAGTLQAGDGFAELGRSLGYQVQPGQEKAFWRSQVEAIASYWSGAGEETAVTSPRNTRIRAKLTSVMAELEEIKRLLDEPESGAEA
jgi:hypothetical protein